MIAGCLALFQGESREGTEIERQHEQRPEAAALGIWQRKIR
jgi:hypothetical protein